MPNYPALTGLEGEEVIKWQQSSDTSLRELNRVFLVQAFLSFRIDVPAGQRFSFAC